MKGQFWLAAGAALFVSGAAFAETAKLDDNLTFKSGEDAYAKICARCHTGKETTVGPNLFTGNHDIDSLSYFVRNGSGPMPAFTASMIDDKTLEGIAAYVAKQSEGAAQ